ncbi:hypothetical protein J1N35_017903 [Gossypium stocksii]|uniref:Uncharacterized protein n=1 Tax=Gossypium stocksii TaxID=47602 RepID=A0A9D3VMZ7_9ROSI|nr:hypothetical protein J1N35_017903 [Gossypium stocksii]
MEVEKKESGNVKGGGFTVLELKAEQSVRSSCVELQPLTKSSRLDLHDESRVIDITCRTYRYGINMNSGCASKRIDCMTYVDEVYRLKRAYNIWKSKFPPVPNKSMWSPTLYTPFELVPNKNSWRKPKGWPNSTRI